MSLMQMIFGKKEPIDLTNSIIVDVRTPSEYAGGHVKGSINIPLNVLPEKMKTLSKDKQIVTCCASGMRSGSAENILKKAGFNAVNGGSWASLQ